MCVCVCVCVCVWVRERESESEWVSEWVSEWEREREREHTVISFTLPLLLNLSLPSPQNFGMIGYLTHAATLHILMLCFLIKQRNHIFFYVKGRTSTVYVLLGISPASNCSWPTTIWRRGNTQKNIYNIQITAKVWNQELVLSAL